MKRQLRRIDIVLGFIALIVVGFFALAAILLYIEKSSQHAAFRQVEQRIDNLKKLGIPTDHESLKSLYISRTDPTNTAAWNKVFEHLKSEHFQAHRMKLLMANSNALSGQSPLNDLQRTIVQQNADLLSTVHELAANPNLVQHNADYSMDAASLHLMFSQETIELLTGELSVRIAEKNSTATFDSLIAQLRLLAVIQGDDLTLSHSTYAMIQEKIIANIKFVLQQNALEQSELEGLVSELKLIPDKVQNWPQIVHSNQAQQLPYLRGQLTIEEFESPPLDKLDIAHTTGKDLLNYLVAMERMAGVNWSSWKTAKDGITAIREDIQYQEKSAFPWDRHNWRLTSFEMLGWLRDGEQLAEKISQRNQAIIACGIELYKAKHGHFPHQLNQLVDIGIDPMNYLSMADLPFGYEIKDDIPYLWGPVEEDYEYRLEIIPTIPQVFSNSPDELASFNRAVWRLCP